MELYKVSCAPIQIQMIHKKTLTGAKSPVNIHMAQLQPTWSYNKPGG